ncbi:5-oxoprolinase subunit PxpB [Paraburkholderia sediminicola]|uniref:5-oxoprolinase subunit PxpB n=1 Tax=Paraburkholderia sediminicola TaxID=458836 RepID=UPI0038BDAAFC
MPTAKPVAQGVPRIHAAGSGAILFDPAGSIFDLEIQQRLQALATRIADHVAGDAFSELVLGVNNLLFIFNPLACHPDDAADLMMRLWDTTESVARAGREIEIAVTYGGAAGEDLAALATSLFLDVDEYVRRHSSAAYTVACIGSMPGFAYMTGLPGELTVPRRKVPRMKVDEGTVIIGGTQAGVMPCTAPSGWHLLGKTDTRMFDPYRSQPCTLSPGDQVKFVVKGIEA